jgi:hypothetical protein
MPFLQVPPSNAPYKASPPPFGEAPPPLGEHSTSARIEQCPSTFGYVRDYGAKSSLAARASSVSLIIKLGLPHILL